jgi:hypothetical protein
MYFVKFRQSIFGAGVVLSKPCEEMEEAAAAKVDVSQVRALDDLLAVEISG